MLNKGPYTTESQLRIQWEKDTQKKFRRLLRKKYDKAFFDKHGVPRRKGREDHVLLLDFIQAFVRSGELETKEALVLSEKSLLRIKGLHAKGRLSEKDVTRGQAAMANIRAAILSSFRIGQESHS